MFKSISISFILIAVTVLMAHAVIPHHEHGDFVCFEINHQENSANNENPTDTHICCLQQQDLIRNQDENESIHVNNCHEGNSCDCCFIPILLFLGDFFDIPERETETINKPYLNLYTSVDLRSTNSLRGPPQT